MMTLAISAWSAISPYGYGRDAFADGINARVDPSVPAGPELSVPDERACLVPDFDVRELLGTKGTRAMDRLSALAVCTAGQLIDDIGLESLDDTGVVFGTTIGSAQSMMDMTRTSLQAEKPYFVQPANVPHCVMNSAAGQIAIWHQLRGPNATIAADRATGLKALHYARRLLMNGRARQVLCGAAEEYSHARSWLEYHRRGQNQVTGEGCAMLLLEPEAAARRPLAYLVDVRSSMCLDGDFAATMDAEVRRLLAAHEIEAAQVWAATGDEPATLEKLFGDEVVNRVAAVDLIGDTAAASSVFGVAAVLSAAAVDPSSAGRFAVVGSVADDNSVACALLQLPGGTP